MMDQLKYKHLYFSNPPICPAYCDCDFPNCLALSSYKGNILETIKCRCGEEDWHSLEWLWHKGDADAEIDGRDITFHPSYSQGTAIVRGNRELAPGMVHFWEMRIITPLSGTDVMFGVGTDDFNYEMYRVHFSSPLGINKKSWGYSYHGRVKHDSVKRNYGERITQGCILGVYLDRARGYLEYFLNRRSLGVAFTNIPLNANVKLYPLVSSTSAKSIVRLMNATSKPISLQMLTFKALSKNAEALEYLRQMPGFTKLLRDYWFLAPPVRYSRSPADQELDLLDVAVLPKNIRLKRRENFNVCTIKEDDENEIDDDIGNFYPNPRKMPMHDVPTESDFEFFDEFFHSISASKLH